MMIRDDNPIRGDNTQQMTCETSADHARTISRTLLGNPSTFRVWPSLRRVSGPVHDVVAEEDDLSVSDADDDQWKWSALALRSLMTPAPAVVVSTSPMFSGDCVDPT